MTVISFEHRFIFVKTRKVAGTSIEALLRQYMGRGAVATPLTPRDEKWCADRGLFSGNYSDHPPMEQRFTALSQSGDFASAQACLQEHKRVFASHMPAVKIKASLERMGYRWDDFHSFSVDRHPYSWLLSLLLYDNSAYQNSGSCEVDLEGINRRAVAFLHSESFAKKYNYHQYAAGDQLLVNQVIRYESLHVDLARIMRPLVGPIDLSGLPHLKQNASHLSPLAVFDQDTLSLVRQKCGATFDALGYE